jgi:hypothetical protein
VDAEDETMSEQPRYFTSIDLFLKSVHITLIAAGCYSGWLIGHWFVSMMIGGAAARVVWLVGWTALQSRIGDHRFK